MFLPSPPQQIKEISYHSSFSEHLRVSRITTCSGDHLPLDTEKAFRKYYGKRVTKFLYKGQSSSLRPTNRYKALQSFKARAYSHSVMELLPSKTIKRLDIEFIHSIRHFQALGPSKIEKKHPHLERNIAQCKHIESLRMTRPLNLTHISLYKNIRKLNRLQSLDLILTEKLLVNSKYLLALKSLRQIKLKISTTNDNLDREALELCLKLLASKQLQVVCLDLKHWRCSGSLLNTLLGQIGQTSVPYFNISLAIKSKDPISNESLDAALNKVDLFKVNFGADASNSFACSTQQSQNASHDQAKRILNLSVMSLRNRYLNKVTTTTPLECNTLIRDINDLFCKFFSRYIPFTPDISNINGLKKMSLDFSRVNPSTSIIEQLVRVFSQATALEHLIFRDRVLRQSTETLVNFYKLLAAEIKNLKNLTSLRLHFDGFNSGYLQLFMKSLPHLDKLQRFYFTYQDLPSKMNIAIMFPENSKLTELEIMLPIMNSGSKANFITTIGKLTELQKINIMRGTQLLTEQKSRKKLMKALLDLTKLREVSITDYISHEVSPSLSTVEIQENEKVAAELRDFTERIFGENRNLERVFLKKSHYYNIKYIRY